MYAHWIDACDAVAKDTSDPPGDNVGLYPYYESASGNGPRSSGMQVDRHLLTAVEGEDDGQGDYR